LSDLSAEEELLVSVLQRRAREATDQNEFDAFWMKFVSEIYRPRLTHREIQQTKVYRIARDLSERVSVRLGLARQDYRDQLAELIRTQFASRKEFSKATGLSEDMISHVLRRRKHLSIETLEKALGRIGYTLRFVPKSE
jgi:hypothetical protein